MSPRYFLLLVMIASIMSSCIASIKYTSVSKTLDGKPCMSTCVDSKCFVDQYLRPTGCTIDPLAGVPVHPTALWRGNKHYCLSNCGKWGGHNYMWCYTTENEWDFCNDEVITPGVNSGRDIFGRRCVDQCNMYRSSEDDERQCHLESQEYVTCTLAGHLPVQSRTNIFQEPHRVKRGLDKLFSPKYCSPVCQARFRDGRDGETNVKANSVYSIYSNVNTVTTFPAGSPYRLVATTTVTNANNQQVLLPLIVEARIETSVYIPRSGEDVPTAAAINVNRMYNVAKSVDRPGIQVGHLLAYMNGGSRDTFNFVGQTEQLNKGPYKTVENFINDWLRMGYVDFKVVVAYIGTRPSEFYMKVKFYNNDGSLYSDCLDMVFKNI